jgi:hypothetical protein
MQSESFAFFYFCVSLYGNPVTKLCSFGFWTFGTFGTLRTGGRSPRGSQSPSPQPLPQKAPTNFNKFQRKSFASRRSLTAKSCRPIGNKKKPSTHARTHITSHTHARYMFGGGGGGGGAFAAGEGGEAFAAGGGGAFGGGGGGLFGPPAHSLSNTVPPPPREAHLMTQVIQLQEQVAELEEKLEACRDQNRKDQNWKHFAAFMLKEKEAVIKERDELITFQNFRKSKKSEKRYAREKIRSGKDTLDKKYAREKIGGGGGKKWNPKKTRGRRGGSVNAVRTTGFRPCVATPAIRSKPDSIGEHLASVGGEGGVRCAVRYECLMNAFFSPPNLAFRSIFDPSFLFPNFSQNLYGQLTWQKITSFAFQRSIFAREKIRSRKDTLGKRYAREKIRSRKDTLGQRG